MLAFWRVADPAADEQRILQRLVHVPFGKLVIGAVAFGSAGYAAWLLFQAVFDPYRFGNSWKGLAQRAGIALSTLAYGVLASRAVMVLLGEGRHGQAKRQHLVGAVLRWPGGQWLVGTAGAVMAVVGLYQLKYVYGGNHRRRIQLRGRSRVARRGIDALAWAGYGARCAILLVLGYFLLRAAWSFNPRAVGDTDRAFDFLDLGGSAIGDALFTSVAVGTVCYGVFMYLNGLYFDFGEDRVRRDP
jgi:uncharacterized protein DUF1206